MSEIGKMEEIERGREGGQTIERGYRSRRKQTSKGQMKQAIKRVRVGESKHARSQ